MSTSPTHGGKVALVTGSSRGIGRAIALALAQRGYSVSINHRDSARQAAATVEEVRKLKVPTACIQADTADDASCRRLIAQTVEELGRLDVLINNAATTRFIPFDQLDAVDTEVWERLFAVNVRGVFQCVRAARPHLDATGDGQVINITSVAGIIGNGSSIPYCASKAALINMTLALARTLAPTIRVNSVAPGFVESQWTRDGLGPQYAATVEQKRARAALQQVSQPEDVAAAVLSLVDGSRLVTGQTLVCDGGALLCG